MIAERIWKREILVADNEELENMDAVEIRARRISAKDVLTPTRSEHFILQVPDGTTKLSGRDHEFREPTPRREPTVRSEDFSRELHGELGQSKTTETTDDAETRNDFWSIEGDFIHRHHTDHRDHFYVPKEENSPFHCGTLIH